MALMGSRELAALAADVATVQPDMAAIRRATAASDGMGGTTRTWATVATVGCRITSVDQQTAEQEIGARLADKAGYRIAMPAGTDVRVTDRVQIGTTTYAIEAVRDRRSVEVERVAYASKAAA